MPTLNITIPNKDFHKVKEYARREGFKNPTEWAEFLVKKNIELEESPRLKSSEIIRDMKKTGLYHDTFLGKLKKSLDYADKTAQ